MENNTTWNDWRRGISVLSVAGILTAGAAWLFPVDNGTSAPQSVAANACGNLQHGTIVANDIGKIILTVGNCVALRDFSPDTPGQMISLKSGANVQVICEDDKVRPAALVVEVPNNQVSYQSIMIGESFDDVLQGWQQINLGRATEIPYCPDK